MQPARERRNTLARTLRGRAVRAGGTATLLIGLIITAAVLIECADRMKALAASLDASVGRATRADVLQRWGPPNQTVAMDGDEFWTYRQSYVGVADSPSRVGEALQGRPESQTTQQPSRLIILRFDGVSGVLKAWSVRE
jgi:hypothetical protein